MSTLCCSALLTGTNRGRRARTLARGRPGESLGREGRRTGAPLGCGQQGHPTKDQRAAPRLDRQRHVCGRFWQGRSPRNAPLYRGWTVGDRLTPAPCKVWRGPVRGCDYILPSLRTAPPLPYGRGYREIENEQRI